LLKYATSTVTGSQKAFSPPPTEVNGEGNERFTEGRKNTHIAKWSNTEAKVKNWITGHKNNAISV
jgi:hypothetical protein